MKKKIIVLCLCSFVILSLYADNIKGKGYGSNRQEARANAIYDIKTQIIVEQKSYTEIKTVEKNGKVFDSFSSLITEYSRELPLEDIDFVDSEDKTKPFGENWYSEAIISGSSAVLYNNKLKDIAKEITTINKLIIDDVGEIKNISWQKTLLDLCYDFLNYSLIVKKLDSSITIPEIPISFNRVRLEYEDMVKREKNEMESKITSMSLLLANGDLGDKQIEELRILQKDYLETTNNLNKIYGDNRDTLTFSTLEYSSSNPITASDFLLRIEANRKAFDYYRKSPIIFETKLIDVAKAAISDLDEISKTVFKTSSEEDDLTFEILKYSKVNEGWIGRATILLGESTLQFSFLIPYENLVGSSYFDNTYKRWDELLTENPEKYIKLNISYTVKGDYIGNSFGFTIRSLTIDKITDLANRDGILIYKASNKNPKTIDFNYGTSVDLGDVGTSVQAKQIRAKANQETKGAMKYNLYVLPQISGVATAPFDLQNLNLWKDNYYLNFGGNIALEAGIQFQNEKEGLEKELYGIGVKGAYSFLNNNAIFINKTDFVTYSAASSYEFGLAIFKIHPLDGTLDNYSREYIDFGYGFGSSNYVFCDLGSASSKKINDNLFLLLDCSVRVKIGAYVEVGIKPNIRFNIVI